MILKASAEKGSLSELGLDSSACVSGFTPMMDGTSIGEGM